MVDFQIPDNTIAWVATFNGRRWGNCVGLELPLDPAVAQALMDDMLLTLKEGVGAPPVLLENPQR